MSTETLEQEKVAPVVVEPAGVGKVKVVGMAQIASELLYIAFGIVVFIYKFGVVIDTAFGHCTFSWEM